MNHADLAVLIDSTIGTLQLVDNETSRAMFRFPPGVRRAAAEHAMQWLGKIPIEVSDDGNRCENRTVGVGSGS